MLFVTPLETPPQSCSGVYKELAYLMVQASQLNSELRVGQRHQEVVGVFLR